MTERLQKFLARAGVASRRKCEELIIAGEVEVDGRIVSELGTVIDPLQQTVKVRGQTVFAERVVCVVLHKPVSYVTTVSDPQGRRTVLDLLTEVRERVYPVGRLDYDTSGLLLLSNDGELTYRLLHPKHHVEKVYRATVLGMPSAETLRQLQTGVTLDDGVTSPAVIHVLRHHPKESVVEIMIHEGRNRQVRRMFEAVSHPVKRLKRIRFGPLELGTLQTGEWRLLTAVEQRALYEAVGMTPPEPLVLESKAQANTKNRPKKNRNR
ncbi:pseudouridine synthase [Alicyclobacillus mengziensis]|uniref:Pseudouridine synthase n=1 Tax=Alicyclobacillus mengziensis TaxID=2931921 RepID=A0A9X7VV66_9BACL|nr:pseudouridine synthase [Alicyclobacillus mengziensis]QSO45774.1 rRNA pseudouridine synthase [Alicyclobacillus mengziensis]